MAENDVLRAPHVLEYPYSRSVGPVIGAFLTGLRDGTHPRGVARRRRGPTVIVPPTEYDPTTGGGHRRAGRGGPGRRGHDVGVGGRARARTTRSSAPSPGRSCRLDGADTAMLHVVDGGVARAP